MDYASQGISRRKALHFLSLAMIVAFSPGAKAAEDQSSPPNGIVDFHSIKEVLDLVPHHEIMQMKVSSQAEAAKAAANTLLAQKAVGKWITCKVKILKWEPWDDPGVVPSKFKITIPEQPVNVAGTIVNVHAEVFCGANAEEVVKKLNPRAEITITSFLNRVDFNSNKNEGVRFNLDLRRSKIELK